MALNKEYESNKSPNEYSVYYYFYGTKYNVA